MREYTQKQVLEDIKSVGDGREEDIKLPIAILKREQPEAYLKAYDKAYRKTDKYKSSRKAYRKTDKHKAYRKAYDKAYRKTDKYKAYQKSYDETDKYKAYQKSYQKARLKALLRLKEMYPNDFKKLLNNVSPKKIK